MKRYLFLYLLPVLFTLSTCGPTADEGEQNGIINPGDEDPYQPEDLEDPECEELSAILPNDVITKFDLLSEVGEAFYASAISSLKKKVPDFIHFDVHLNQFANKLSRSKILEFDFFYKKIPLCYEHAKMYTISNKMTLTGLIPSANTREPKNEQLPSFTSEISKVIENKLGLKEILLDEKEKELCYTVVNNELTPAWKVKVRASGNPYEALVEGDQLISLKPKFFHLRNITAEIFSEEDSTDNPKVMVLEELEAEGVSSGGTLCSERIRVVAADGKALVSSEDASFDFNPDSASEFFDQTALFIYAHLQTEYMTSLKLVDRWYGPQIEVMADNTNNGFTNGAVYMPGDSLTKPQIRIPKGDGVKLHNIRRDNEAVQHEVGHHVLYRSVQDGRGESGVIHEGIADAFVMMRTQDSCLGEHLCLNDLICVSNECLRNADNHYTLTSPDLPFEAHLQSQLISGLIWDIGVKVGFDKAANWLNYTIDFLPKKAYFSDLVIALYGTINQLVESKVFKNTKSTCKSLMAVYEKRGFKSILEQNELTCADL